MCTWTFGSLVQSNPTVWIGYQPITGLPLQIVRFPWGSVNKKQNYMELFSQKKKRKVETRFEPTSLLSKV